MDLDRAFIAALVSAKRAGLKTIIEKGIESSLLKEEGQKVFNFILEYSANYSDFPTKEVIEAKLGIPVERPQGKLEFFADELFNRRLHETLRTGVGDLAKFLEGHDPVGGFERLESLVFNARKLKADQSRVQSLPALGKDVIAYYDRIKSGERGILMPWPTINEETLGLWPEDLVLFVARSGIGKSWCLVLLSDCFWNAGKKVLFVTTEMSQLRIAMRFFSLKYKLPYDDLRKGRLGEFQEQALRKYAEEVYSAEGLHIIGGGFDFKIETFEAAIDDAKPDVVLLDGTYLLKVAGGTRTEQAANSFNELKRIGKRKKIPICVTTQLNREAKKNVTTSIQAENIALTDVAQWNADLAFGLVQTDDMRRDKRLIVKPLKGREGVIPEIEINWDFEQMLFTELPKRQGDFRGGDEFGTGVEPYSKEIDSDGDLPF